MTRQVRILPVAEVGTDLRTAMLGLMQEHYEQTDAATFAADLAGKRWVIVLEEAGTLVGFSTQTVIEVAAGGSRHRLLFSGDTIIAGSARGGLDLPVAWGCLMRALRAREPRPLHWFLISKGYKTYRFLPVFFHDFIPGWRRASDAPSLALLDAAARQLFPARWDAQAGIVRAGAQDQRLRPGVADLEPARLGDPDVAFFAARNPGHARGDELACLARFDEDNLSPFIRRQLDRARIALPDDLR